MRLCIFEDRGVETLAPLIAARPAFALRCGALTLAEKISYRIPRVSVSFHVREYLSRLVQEENSDIPVNRFDGAETCLVNGRVIADAELASFIRKNAGSRTMLVANGDLVAVHVDRAIQGHLQDILGGDPLVAEYFSSYKRVPYSGSLVRYPWELVDATAGGIVNDFGAIVSGKKLSGKRYEGAHLLGKKNIVVGAGSTIRPGAVLDAEKGPIIIGRNVTVMSNAVIEGPAFIGDHSIVKIGAKIYHGTSIGPWCKVGGEVEASVIQSYSNKQHDGFLGHSYLGSWVNLGADTNTSDLKNTYGNVHVQIGGRSIDTGRQFVGLFMGDHSKTGINAMFNTGTVVGFSCNIIGAGLPPKYIPSFTWGGDGALEEYDVEKSVGTARKVMLRRKIEMSRAYEEVMRSIHAASRREARPEGVMR